MRVVVTPGRPHRRNMAAIRIEHSCIRFGGEGCARGPAAGRRVERRPKQSQNQSATSAIHIRNRGCAARVSVEAAEREP